MGPGRLGPAERLQTEPGRLCLDTIDSLAWALFEDI